MKNVFSERLGFLMAKYDLKQTDIIRMAEPYCKKYGVKLTKSALSQYLSGAKIPKYDKIKIFEYIFDISADWLAGFSDDPNLYHKEPEPDILPLYALLNDLGKKKMIDYLADLIENPKYRKEEQ